MYADSYDPIVEMLAPREAPEEDQPAMYPFACVFAWRAGPDEAVPDVTDQPLSLVFGGSKNADPHLDYSECGVEVSRMVYGFTKAMAATWDYHATDTVGRMVVIGSVSRAVGSAWSHVSEVCHYAFSAWLRDHLKASDSCPTCRDFARWAIKTVGFSSWNAAVVEPLRVAMHERFGPDPANEEAMDSPESFHGAIARLFG